MVYLEFFLGIVLQAITCLHNIKIGYYFKYLLLHKNWIVPVEKLQLEGK
jgi:hypothetical protein